MSDTASCPFCERIDRGDCEALNAEVVAFAPTQTVRHLHVHIVPRHEGDGLALPWTGQVA